MGPTNYAHTDSSYVDMKICTYTHKLYKPVSVRSISSSLVAKHLLVAARNASSGRGAIPLVLLFAGLSFCREEAPVVDVQICTYLHTS